jgi:hypothetical protein
MPPLVLRFGHLDRFDDGEGSFIDLRGSLIGNGRRSLQRRVSTSRRRR